MLDNYRRILSHAPARRFSVAGLVARLPISMNGLAIILMIEHRTGKYGIATTVAATASLAGATLSPLMSKAADRFGQSRVLMISAVNQGIGLAGLILSVTDRVMPTAFLFAALLGGGSASIGSFIRSRWSAQLGADPLKQTAFAWEAIVDEIVFIIGPVTTTMTSAHVNDTTPLILAIVFTTVGSLWLAAQHSTEPKATRAPVKPAHASASPMRSPLTTAGIAGVVVAFAFLGGTFAAADTSTVAFATQHGHKAFGGVLLGIWAFGSLLGGAWYGTRPPRIELPRYFTRVAAALSLSMLPLPIIAAEAPMPLVTMASMMWLSGFLIAPTLICGFSLVEQMSHGGRVTESLSWSMSGLGIGIAAGNAVVGRVIDGYGVVSAMWLMVALSACSAVIGLFNSRSALRRLAATRASHDSDAMWR